ncbi:MAG: hypothetical protein IT458_10355 [Planctomycetes bacterium]|nr:hypothetical protein [Planctomycetota bacterium]
MREVRGPALVATRILLAALLLLGLWLRVQQLPDQVVADDEFHALRMALASTPLDAVASFGTADHSIPLVLYDQFLLATVGASELTLRLPMLLAGVGLLLLLAFGAQAWLPVSARLAAVALVATSPILVNFSRYARPYALTAFVATLGWLAFWRYWRGGAARFAALWAACVAFGAWLHLAAVPALLAPALVAAVAARLPGVRAERRTLAEVAAWSGAALAGTLALLAVPLANDLAALRDKAGAAAQQPWDPMAVAGLLGGTAEPLLLVVLAGLAVAGAWWLGRADRLGLAYLLAVVLAPLAAVVVVRPVAVEVPIVAARYLLTALPVVLVLVALGVGAAETLLARRVPALPRGLLGLALAAVVFLCGPGPELLRAPQAFPHHAAFQYGYDPARNPYRGLAAWADAPFLRELGRAPAGSQRVLVTPFFYDFARMPQPFAQAVHRQRCGVAFLGEVLGVTGEQALPSGHAGLRLAQTTHLASADRLRALGFDLLVLDKVLLRRGAQLPEGEATEAALRAAVARLAQSYGAPLHDDAWLAAWRLR